MILTNTHKITKAEFLKEFEPMRRSLRGHGPEICRSANVTAREYERAKLGALNDPLRLSAILNACNIKYQELQDKYHPTVKNG